MEFKSILVEESDGIVTLTLNNPENRNAMSYEMADEFYRAIQWVKEADDARVLVLTGRGSSFCSGGDFNTIIRDLEKEAVAFKPHIMRFYGRFLCITDLVIPTIAAVNGHAMGAGFCLALACDMRLASRNATFGMTFVRLGLHAGMGGTYFLPRIAGTARALELLLTGEIIDAERAERMGILNAVTEEEALMEQALNLARKIARGPAVPIRLMKQSVYHGMKRDLKSSLELESYAQALCTGTEDLKEGISAFKEKRKPLFKGK